MNKKTLLSTLGVIVLGALGSGLWELIKPLLSWGWSGILTLSTLGMDSLRDEMYVDAATGASKSIGTVMAVQLLGTLIMITGVAIISYIRISFRPNPHPLARAYCLMLFVGAIALCVSVSRTGYVNQLFIYSTKLETIAAPHLSDTQLKQLRAKYVLIDSRAAYLAHVAALRKVIETAGQSAPDREFF
jgi:hypothetical protein